MLTISYAVSRLSVFDVCFCFNETATTEIYTYGHTLSLHDALPICGLTGTVVAATHRVRALRCFVFPEPSVKTSPLKALSLGARVAVLERRDRYLRIAPEGWVHETALEPAEATAPDWVATARRFLGVPYLWGGRSSLGIDCSGLVQVADRKSTR